MTTGRTRPDLHRPGRLDPADPWACPSAPNDLARCLGLPLDAADAARVVLAGTDRPIDLLDDVHDGLVVDVVHAGLGGGRARGGWPARTAPPPTPTAG